MEEILLLRALLSRKTMGQAQALLLHIGIPIITSVTGRTLHPPTERCFFFFVFKLSVVTLPVKVLRIQSPSEAAIVESLDPQGYKQGGMFMIKGWETSFFGRKSKLSTPKPKTQKL